MKISPLRNDYGVVIEATSPLERINSLNTEQIKNDLKKNAVILFRGFDNSIQDFEQFTLQYAQKMVRNREVFGDPKNLYYRENVSGDSLTATVNVHKGPIGWHSEDCHLPAGPDIMFFYCERPPVRGGATLLTDGIEIFDQSDETMRDYLMTHRMAHKWDLPVSDVARFMGVTPDKVEETALRVSQGLREGETLESKVDGERFHMKYTVPLVRTPKWSNRHAFCNRLLLDRVVLPARKREDSMTTIIPSTGDNFSEILRVADSLAHLNAYHLHWQASDIVMFDNTRVMHGRAAIQDDERRILTRGCIANF